MRVIQISDLHLFADPKQTLLGLNTSDSLHAVIDLLKQTSKPIHLILLTGDLSQDNSPASYQRIVEQFKDFACPIYWTPGNHDAPDIIPTVFNKSVNFKEDKAIVCGNWQFILLNSHYPKHVEGFLGRAELSRLERYLLQNPKHHTMLFLHHPPIEIHCKWLDPLMLKNANDLFDVIDQHPNVRGIFCGHIHQEFETQHQGVPIMSVPSTCFQFLPESVQFAIDQKAPGYRWLDLSPNGSFKTGIERVKNFVNTADATQKGY